MIHVATNLKRCPHPAEIIARGIGEALGLVAVVVALVLLAGCAGKRGARNAGRATSPPQFRIVELKFAPEPGFGVIVFESPAARTNWWLEASTNGWQWTALLAIKNPQPDSGATVFAPVTLDAPKKFYRIRTQ